MFHHPYIYINPYQIIPNPKKSLVPQATPPSLVLPGTGAAGHGGTRARVDCAAPVLGAIAFPMGKQLDFKEGHQQKPWGSVFFVVLYLH